MHQVISASPHMGVKKECEPFCKPWFEVGVMLKDEDSMPARLSCDNKTASAPGDLGEDGNCSEAGIGSHYAMDHAACPRQTDEPQDVFSGVCSTATRSLVRSCCCSGCSDALRQEEEFQSKWQ